MIKLRWLLEKFHKAQPRLACKSTAVCKYYVGRFRENSSGPEPDAFKITINGYFLPEKYHITVRFGASPCSGPDTGHRNYYKQLYLLDKHPYKALFVSPSRRGLLRTYPSSG